MAFTFSLFGSYVRDEATENSDLEFVMDKCDLKGLQYVYLVQDLENEFNCHIDVISKGSSNKNFLRQLVRRKFFYMNEKDKRCAETIIDYCNCINDYLNRFDEDKEIYMSDSL